MRSVTISLFILLNINLLYSQTWPKYYGQANRIDRPWDLIETYDKGYLMLGNYPEFSWLIKTDINGHILWEKIIDNEPNPLGTSLAIEAASDGGILVCGIALSAYSNKYYPYVMKLNACGEKEWCKIFEGSPNDSPWAQDIKETDSGDVVVLVTKYGSIPEETIHLFKLTSDGEVLWKQAYATTFDYPNTNIKIGKSLFINSNNEYLISGDAYWEQPWNPGGAMPLTPLFIMVDSDGTEEWVLPFGLNDTIIGRAFSATEVENGLFIGMAHDWGASLIPLFAEFDQSGQETDFRLLHSQNMDPDLTSGTLTKMYNFDSKHYAQGTFIYEPDQSIPITVVELENDIFGLDTIVSNSVIHHGHFSPSSFTKTFDNKLLSNSTITTSSVNKDISLAKLNLNLEYDTAYTGNYTYDSLCIPGPPQSGFIYLDDCDIITSIEMPSAAEYRAKISHIPIRIFPNPANAQITFALENTEHHRNIELRCFNLLGLQQHHARINSGQQQAAVNVSGWPPGMYVAAVYSNGHPVGRGKFVVRR
ncbi:MAG: T9SS type A sorting domain-containing protein [Bacteroidales bacterium]|nr:T9SS type A sorting domain-containing protein [Bacteroidales bacterium]